MKGLAVLIIFITFIGCKCIKTSNNISKIYLQAWVVDEHKVPIDRVKVTYLENNKIVTYTNEEGYFKLTPEIIALSPLTFEKENYITKTVKTTMLHRGNLYLLYTSERKDTIILKRKH